MATIANKVKLIAGTMIVGAALTFSGAELHSIGTSVSPEPVIVTVQMSNNGRPIVHQLSNIPDKFLSHEEISGYCRIKRKLVEQGKTEVIDSKNLKSVQSTDQPTQPRAETTLPPMEIIELACGR